MFTTDEIRGRIAPIAEKYQIRRVYLFGSYARNEVKDDSDIDILVDIEGSRIEGWAIGGLYNDLTEAFGENNVDLITTDVLKRNQDKNKKPKFTESVLKDRVLIYEQ